MTTVAKAHADRNAFGRMEEDVLELAPALKTATGFATIAAAEKGIAFDVGVSEDAPAFEADAMRLQQIVVNLVGNAVKLLKLGELRFGLV